MKRPSRLIPSALLATWFSSAQSQDCSYEKYNFDSCVAISGGSASTACESCVNLFFPGLHDSCLSINNGVCTGLEKCPCGTCDSSALQYYSCLTGYRCYLGSCPAAPPSTPSCQGTPISDCKALFSSRACLACDNDADCIDDLASCKSGCKHPGCSCEIEYGACNPFDPPSSSPTIIQCSGYPIRCGLLVTESSCNLASGCVWVEPTLPIEEDGVCMGSGILSCYSEFAGDTCSACSTADCLSTFNTCQQSCTHPGCSCNLDLGTCEGVSGTKSPSTVRCTGSPLSCGQLETKTSCDLAQNCIWVVDTEPDGLCRGGGSDISSCSALFPSFTFSVCDYLPLNEYTVCLRDCTHPGCECKVDSGVCNIGPIFVGGTSTLSCTGTPTKCSDIKTEQSCTQAPGCFWEMSTAPEPTYCDSDVDVDIDLKCMNDDNLACSMIHPPRDTKCATGESIFTLVFSYQASACALESNQQLDNADCEDTGNINPSSNVKIVCVDADQVSRAIDVEPNVVGRGDRVRITNPSVGPLPKRLSCAIADSTNNVILQGVVLDTSGNVQLDLKDKYGALQLEGCDSKKCFDRWTFTSSVKNIGTTDLVLRQFELDVAFESSSDPVNLLDGSVNPLLPVGSATAGIDQVRTVDLCGAGNLGANASAVVATAAGIPGSCNFSEALVLPNQPDCNLNMSLTCSGHGDAAKELQGVACQNFVGEPEQRCKCPDCARELRFRYTGELCGPNVPGAKCRNVTSAMPHSAARVLIRRGYTDMLDVPRVEVGRDVIFRNRGGCLPNDFTMFAMRVGTSIVSQQVDIVTNCNNVGIPLMGSFGGFNFSGYSCNDTNVHNCFVDVAHNACIENDGTATRVLESFMLDVTGTSTEVFNLLDGTNANDRQLTAGEKYCDTRITQIKLCTNNTKYTTIASAGVGTLCPDAGVVSQGLNFSIFGSGVRPPPPEDIEPEDPSSPDGCPTGPVSVFDPPPPPGCTRKQ